MIISPYTPLFFSEPGGDGIPSPYIQTFAKTDSILVECLCSPTEQPCFNVVKLCTGQTFSVECRTWQVNESLVMRFLCLKGLDNGVYVLREQTNELESMPFRVTDNGVELAKTCLLQYSMQDNRQRTDAIFRIAGYRMFFSFRVPGGFKASDWSFSVDSEQFTTSEGDLVTLYSSDSVQKKFTMGRAEGVHVGFAELLNRILSCSYVYIDKQRYVRVGTSVPEATVLAEGTDSFVYKVNLQKVCHLSPTIENENLISIRRDYADEVYRGYNNINLLIE